MKRNILLLSILLMLGLMIFTNVDHIIWIMEYAKTGFNWTEELLPLIINNIIWLAIIPLFLLWKTETEISTLLLWLMIATVIIQIATSIYARIADDPLAAGLPFVIMTIPVSVILLVFSIKELRSS